MSLGKPELPGGAISGLVAKAVEYMLDAGQRSVLFLDIMRQRGDQYREHVAQTAPNVLSYAAELIIDGRKLPEPVNYALVRIIPPKGVAPTSQRTFTLRSRRGWRRLPALSLTGESPSSSSGPAVAPGMHPSAVTSHAVCTSSYPLSSRSELSSQRRPSLTEA